MVRLFVVETTALRFNVESNQQINELKNHQSVVFGVYFG